MAPCTWSAVRAARYAASPAIDLRRRDCRGRKVSAATAAPYTSGRASSSRVTTSASRCLIAWYSPMARPYWLRCFAYATEASRSHCPAPRSCADTASTPRSNARAPSAAGSALSRDPGTAAGPGRSIGRLFPDAGDDLVDPFHVEDHSGDVGVQGQRHFRRRDDRGEQFTLGERGQPVRRSAPRRDAGRLDQRSRHGVVAERLEGDHHVDRRGRRARPCSSPTSSAGTPRSASAAQKFQAPARGVRPPRPGRRPRCRRRPAVRAAARRTGAAPGTAGTSSARLPRQFQQPLGDRVALDLVGAAVDRVRPGRTGSRPPSPGPSRRPRRARPAPSRAVRRRGVTRTACSHWTPGRAHHRRRGGSPCRTCRAGRHGRRSRRRRPGPVWTVADRASARGPRAGRPRRGTGRGCAGTARARCSRWSSRPASPAPARRSRPRRARTRRSKKISANPGSPSSCGIGRTVTPSARRSAMK